MSKERISIIVTVIWVLLAMGSFGALYVHSSYIHMTLRKFQKRAERAKNRSELIALKEELRTFYNKSCGIRHYGDAALKVKRHIDALIKLYD